jgi:hypothetical protein
VPRTSKPQAHLTTCARGRHLAPRPCSCLLNAMKNLLTNAILSRRREEGCQSFQDPLCPVPHSRRR